LATGAHALVTTPGATRFYRSQKGLARQTVRVHLQAQARLEWLPMETIAYPDCDGLNQAIFQLDPGAEMMAWDLTALGLPGASQPYTRGKFLQHLEIEGVWLERGRLDAQDTALLESPLGLAGYRCMGTLVLAAGAALPPTQRDALLETARDCMAKQEGEDAVIAGVTAAHAQVLVLRTLSHWVEPSQRLLRAVWAAWREQAWAIPAQAPRLWAL
jgi:urease accessory protein